MRPLQVTARRVGGRTEDKAGRKLKRFPPYIHLTELGGNDCILDISLHNLISKRNGAWRFIYSGFAALTVLVLLPT